MFKDEFVRTLLIIVAIVALFYFIQPGFWNLHGGLAHFFGVNSGSSTATSTPPTNSIISQAGNASSSQGSVIRPAPTGALTISGAYISSDKTYKQFEFKLKAGINGPVDVSKWMIKTSRGAYFLPATSVSAGQTIFLISSLAGAAEPPSTSTELRYYLTQDLFGITDTVELLNPAGQLVGKYSY